LHTVVFFEILQVINRVPLFLEALKYTWIKDMTNEADVPFVEER
jgi:hypothetical protein